MGGAHEGFFLLGKVENGRRGDLASKEASWAAIITIQERREEYLALGGRVVSNHDYP